MSFAWIRRSHFIFHLQVSWCTCGTVDSYHLNTGIINGDQVLVVRSKHRDGNFVFEMVKNINVVSGKPVKGIKRKQSEKPPKDLTFKK
jgi:hypothetical protein